eukprot:6201449-Pleurochrysis_carterae.AAC.2
MTTNLPTTTSIALRGLQRRGHRGAHGVVKSMNFSESSREKKIETWQPCRVVFHLVTVSQGRGNVTEGSRHRK